MSPQCLVYLCAAALIGVARLFCQLLILDGRGPGGPEAMA